MNTSKVEINMLFLIPLDAVAPMKIPSHKNADRKKGVIGYAIGPKGMPLAHPFGIS